MALFLSYGSDSVKNGSSVNKNSVATSPTVIFKDFAPGYYTLTLLGIDLPYVHWIKSNMISNATRGSIVANYSGPVPDALDKRRYVLIAWRQMNGRISPPPPAPTNRAQFSMDRFVSKHNLCYVSSVTFLV